MNTHGLFPGYAAAEVRTATVQKSSLEGWSDEEARVVASSLFGSLRGEQNYGEPLGKWTAASPVLEKSATPAGSRLPADGGWFPGLASQYRAHLSPAVSQALTVVEHGDLVAIPGCPTHLFETRLLPPGAGPDWFRRVLARRLGVPVASVVLDAPVRCRKHFLSLPEGAHRRWAAALTELNRTKTDPPPRSP